MSEYRADLRGILWKRGELSLKQVTALSLRCPGDYAHPEGTLVWEVSWLVALKVVQTFGGCTKGIRQLLDKCDKPSNISWESSNVRELVGVTPTGSTLRDYQLKATEDMANRRMLLGDEQGLGKTICVLAAQHVCLLRELRGVRMLVVVPSDEVADEWKRMAAEHFGKQVFVIKGPECCKKQPDAMRSAPIWAITYSKFWRPNYKETMLNFLRAGDNLLVFDEGHRLSGHTSQQHEGSKELVAAAWRTWFTTGTYITNGPDSYWAMYTLVTGSQIKREEWIRYLARGTVDPNGPMVNQAWDEEKLESLARLFPSFGLRRLKTNVLSELPPLIGPIEIPVKMDHDHAVLYAKLKHTHEVELEGEEGTLLMEVNPLEFWTKALRLYQMATHPGLLGETVVKPVAKLLVVADLIRDSGDQKVIIWGHFPDALDWVAEEISKIFPHLRVAVAHGRVKKASRVDIKNEHQQGKIDILVANPMVWGEGITLTDASVAIYWDLHPNRVLWQQSRDRQHRWGQKRPVTIYWPMYEDTVQMRTMANMKGKDRIAGLLTGDVIKPKKTKLEQQVANHLSAQEVRMMLTQANHRL